MWIKRTVGVVIIVTMAVTGLILVKGVFFSKINNVNDSSVVVTSGAQGTPPVITLSVEPQQQVVGQYSVLNWSVVGAAQSCKADGDWSGDKTSTGSASTGRLNDVRPYTFHLTCDSKYGRGEQTVTVNVTEK